MSSPQQRHEALPPRQHYHRGEILVVLEPSSYGGDVGGEGRDAGASPRLVAMLRGNTAMAWSCRINKEYCYIHRGRPNRGKRVICRVLGDTMVRSRSERGSEGRFIKLAGVRNMCNGGVVKKISATQ